MNALLYALPYLLSAAAGVALAWYAWRVRQPYYEARPFALLMYALAFWAASHAVAMLSTSFEAVLLWVHFQYVGIVLVPPLWLIFALSFAGRPRVSHMGFLLLSVVPLCAFVLVLTNAWHHLWWTSVALDTSRPFLALAVTRGPLFWVWISFAYICVLAGIWQFVKTAHEVPALYRRQAAIALLGASVPILGNVALLVGVQIPLLDDPTPCLFVISCLVVWFGALRYRMLDLAPIAQRFIIESLPDGMLVLNRSRVLATINQAAAHLFQIAPDAWIGRPVDVLLAGSPLRDDILALLAEAAPEAARTAIYYEQEALRAVEIRARVLQQPNGELAGLLLLLRDRSEHIEAERVLEQRLTELTLLSQVARTANATAQTDDLLRAVSGQTVRLLDWDRMAVGLLQPDGATLVMAIDTHPDATLEGRSADLGAFASLSETLSRRQPRLLRADDPALRGNATLTMLETLKLPLVLTVPLFQQDLSLGILFVGRSQIREVTSTDIRLFETLGRLISDSIVRTRLFEAAQEASTLKSVFLATVSHELRTPLTSIIGFAEMLQRGMFGQMSPSGQEALEHINRGGQALLRLINDILDFSKMEAGYLSLDLYPVEPGDVIQRVVAQLQPQISERGLTLRLDLDEVPAVHANRIRLEQVLTNLLTNAIKFTEQGGIQVRICRRGQIVRISVEDTGIGIDPSHQRDIFQAFRQVENIYTRRYGGAGLGLAISQRLMHLMGGQLSVESSPGHGSTFHCDLPISTQGIHVAGAPSETENVSASR